MLDKLFYYSYNGSMKKGERMKIGTELRAIMAKERISGYRIFKETGINQSYISRVLHNKVNPGVLTLKRILDVLGYEVRFVKSEKKGGREKRMGVSKEGR
jgi:transcriptional regulator with XRE-family HTH domain